MRTHQRYYRVDRREIAFLRFILEAYDGIAMLQTLDPQRGDVVVYIGRGCLAEFEGIIRDLGKTIQLEPIQPTDERPEMVP